MLKQLLKIAVAKYKKISPCYGKRWNECITNDNGNMILWFNDSQGSTHIVMKRAS